MIYKILILILLSSFCKAQTKLYIKNPSINNAQTALIFLEDENISKAKLTLLDEKNPININFYKNPFKQNSFYALLALSYYKKAKDYKIIVSYFKNNKKTFKSLKLKVKDGKYKSEIINVSKSKFKPNKKLQERVKQEYKQAIKIYKTVDKNIYWNSDFIYPINSKITSDFGVKRVYNNILKSYHSGTDFRAKIGTNILASNSGIVKIAQDRFYSGKSLVIDHGRGVYTCYFHLSKINFKVGDFIKKGEVLGLSGDTGRVTGPHLHFSFRINSLLVDPLQAIEILNSIKN